MGTEAEGVAVIGLAARLPGADTVDEFWRNLANGVESVQFLDDDELVANGVAPEALRDPRYVRAVAQAPAISDFDADLFGMTPREAALCDPQIRMFLETAHAAIENAGYIPGRLTQAGVFGAAGANRYLDLHVRPRPDRLRSVDGMSAGSLNTADSLSTFTSYKLNLTGPTLTVQTACSSSLAAVHLAVNAIEDGECDVALAGGAEVEFPVGHGYWWSEGGPWSRDGHCRPFAAGASGTIFGSGMAVLLLKRLEQAIADGDPIRAVIRGSAMNNDGARKVGFTAPSVVGQANVIAEAMSVAGVTPEQVTMIEAHATGTLLGDPVEIAALRMAFDRLGAGTRGQPWCALSSVKSNVGHLGHAGGAASLMKVVLCLENQRRVATVNVGEINPKLDLDGGPFFVGAAAADWPVVAGRPRVAGVTSLGVGGTNVHVVVQEAPRVDAHPAPHRPRALIWSGAHQQTVDGYRADLAAWLDGRGDDVLAGVGRALSVGRVAHDHRAATVAASTDEAVAALRAMKNIGAVAQRRPVTMLFPGQGAQHPGMAHGLHGADRRFAAHLDDILAMFDAENVPVAQVWRAAVEETPLANTAIAQPLLFAVEYALAQRWQELGVRPSALLGHSIGEITAAAVGGVLTLPDAVRVVAARARLMSKLPEGGMVAVLADAEQTRGLLTEGVTLAVDNGRRQCVVAGDTSALARFEESLRRQSVRFRRTTSSHAFHSPAMAPAVAEFESCLREITLSAPEVPIVSAATGRLLTDEQATDPGFWARQLVDPVLFGPALHAATADGPTVLLEVGPGRTLSSLARMPDATNGDGHLIAATLPARRSDADADQRSVLEAAAQLWTDGQPVDWAALNEDAEVRRVPLPPYRYQRERHWIDPPPALPAQPGQPAAEPARSAPVDAEAEAPTSAFAVPGWAPGTASASAEAGGARALVLLPDDEERRRLVTAALNRGGFRVLSVSAADTPFGLLARRSADLRQALSELASRGEYPDLIVDAGLLGAPEAAAPHAEFARITDVVRLLAKHAPAGAQPGLTVLAERSADVSGSEPVDAGRAALHALVTSLNDENPGPHLIIDIDPSVRPGRLARELSAWRQPGRRAVRGNRTWHPTIHDLPVSPTGDPIRAGGVYLITGGSGGLGLMTATALAGTGLRPTLVLLSRSGVADRTAVDRIRALGSDVETVACDLTDSTAVRTAIADVLARHGRLHGVFHLAGQPGSGMVRFGSPAGAEAVFGPKAVGLQNLMAALAGQPLELLVSFSSWAALDGQLGGADYAAANAWLDAKSRYLPAERVLSINWPAFDGVGMAGATLAGTRPGARVWRRTEQAADDPVTDEHRLDGEPIVPGTGLIDRIVRAFRELFPAPDADVLLKDIVFQNMLSLADPRDVAVVFEPADADGFHPAVVRSAPVGRTSAADVQSHARASIRAVEATRRQEDMEALRATMADVTVPPRRPIGRQAFTLGPRWRAVHQIRTGPAGEQLLAISLPAPFGTEAADHAVHPILLDCATTTARDNERDDIHLPFLYRTLLIRGASLPDGVYSHIRRRPDDEMIVADLDILAEDGSVLVEARGFTMRRAAEAGARRAPRPASSGDRADWLAAEHGAGLLLDLLRADVDGHVVVRRHRDGRPVAGEAPRRDTPASAGPDRPLPDGAVATAPAATQTPAPAQATPAPATGSAGDQLQTTWVSLLGVTEVQDESNFFDLGGNSLTAIELIDRIRDSLGVELPITAVFDHPTLAALAAEVQRAGAR